MTRLLVGSDFHLCSSTPPGRLAEAFASRLGEDVVPIFLGDLVNRPQGDAPVWFETVARWEAMSPDLVVVPGNHDPEDCGPWEGVRVHERRGLRILAIPVIAKMSPIPTWTHEHSESRIASMLAPFEGGRYDVVASHGPPYGVLDRIFDGRHVGSHALLAFASTITFGTWLCGHVHEAGGRRARLAGRPVVNAARSVLDLEVVALPRAPRAPSPTTP